MQYVAMATKDASKGIALWVRCGDCTKVVSYGGLYTKTPEFHVEISQSDLDNIVNAYKAPELISHILMLQTPAGLEQVEQVGE